jgi:hypothetical protein
MRSTAAAPHEGHTNGFWSLSAAISISASGARYSLMPLRPTACPSDGVWWHEMADPTRVRNLPESLRTRHTGAPVHSQEQVE